MPFALLAVILLSFAAGSAGAAGAGAPARPEPSVLAALSEAAADAALSAAVLDGSAPQGARVAVDLSGEPQGREKKGRGPGELRGWRLRPASPRVPGVRALRDRTGKHGAFKTFGAGFLAFAAYPPFFAAGGWIMGYATTGVPGGIIAALCGLAAGLLMSVIAVGVGLVKGFSKLFAGGPSSAPSGR